MEIESARILPSDRFDCSVLLKDRSVALTDLTDEDIDYVRELSRHDEALSRYHCEWIVSGSVYRANLIRHSRKMHFTNYGEVEFALPVNWALGQPGQDNLSWQLHSMFFIRDLVRAHREAGDEWYIQHAIHLVEDWAAKNIVNSPPSPFSWNDHSTAFRLLALSHLFIYCLKHAPHERQFLRLLMSLIVRHQLVLADEQFYSQGTNHGLDQAYYLYVSVVVLNLSDRAHALKELSLARLKFELMSSFAADGVHVENSPEYHDLILLRALEITRFVEGVEGLTIIDNFHAFVKNGLRYLTFVVRPDGCWPPIGDSAIRPPRNGYESLSGFSGYEEYVHAISKGERGRPEPDWHAVFPASGYFVMRSNPATSAASDRVHIVFKCGYLSHYHRQDDDNSFVLYAFGEEWLTDGGLYKHDHRDPQREYLRSHKAHNTLSPVGVRAQRRTCPDPEPRIVGYSTDNDRPWVEGVSGMFAGFVHRRRLSYDGELNLHVTDVMQAVSGVASEYVQFWQVPSEKLIEIDGRTVRLRSQRTPWYLEMLWNEEHFISVEDISLRSDSVYCNRSIEYGVLEPVKVVKVALREGAAVESTVMITFRKE